MVRGFLGIHNPKVGGSIPRPATNLPSQLRNIDYRGDLL